MRILVIGRSGQLATALAERPHGGLELVFAGRGRLDLGCPETIAPVLAETEPDLVVNTAGFTNRAAADRDPDTAIQINTLGIGALAEKTGRLGLPLLHISTSEVFGGRTTHPWRETDHASPPQVFGKTMLEGERIALAENPRTVILRTGWLYAPWGRNFVRTLLETSVMRRTVVLPGNEIGTPTSVLDLAQACLRIVPRIATAGPGDDLWGVFHCTAAGSCSRAEFAAAVFDCLGAPGPQIRRIEDPLSMVDTTLDCGRFRRVFGFSLPPWRPGLKRTLSRATVVLRVPA